MTQTQEAILLHGDGLSMDYTPASALAAGEIVPVGGAGVSRLVGIAGRAIEANELGSLMLDGVFKIKKENTADTYSEGDQISWDETNGYAESDGGVNEDFKIGLALADAAATDDFVIVAINRARGSDG